MPDDKRAFYGFGNYLTGNGSVLGLSFIFVLANDKPAARVLLVQELSNLGDPVPGSLVVSLGSTIPSAWLIAAIMGSEEAAWSSGMPALPTMKIAATRKKEYLS